MHSIAPECWLALGDFSHTNFTHVQVTPGISSPLPQNMLTVLVFDIHSGTGVARHADIVPPPCLNLHTSNFTGSGITRHKCKSGGVCEAPLVLCRLGQDCLMLGCMRTHVHTWLPAVLYQQVVTHPSLEKSEWGSLHDSGGRDVTFCEHQFSVIQCVSMFAVCSSACTLQMLAINDSLTQ